MDTHSTNPLAEIQLCCGTLCDPKQVEKHIKHLQKTVAELRTELVKVTEENNKLLKEVSS